MIGFLIYAAGAILCVYPFSRQMLIAICGTGTYHKIDSMDRGFSILFGCIGAICWPIVLGVFLSYQASKRIWQKLLDDGDKETREKHRV